MDIMSGLSSATALAKAAIDYLEGNQEAQKKIIDLSLQLMDVHQKAMQLIEDNGKLQARMREVEEKQRLNDSVYYQDEACWRNDKEGQEKGPYCHVCWEKERRLLHLDYVPADDERKPDFDPYKLLEEEGEMHGSWMCRSCKGGYRQGWKKTPRKPPKPLPPPVRMDDEWFR